MDPTIYLASTAWPWPDNCADTCTISLGYAIAEIQDQVCYEFRLDRRHDRIYWQDRRELWIRDRLPRYFFPPRMRFVRRPGAARVRSMRWSRRRKQLAA